MTYITRSLIPRIPPSDNMMADAKAILRKKSKADLISICIETGTIYPDRKGLATWRKDELLTQAAEGVVYSCRVREQ